MVRDIHPHTPTTRLRRLPPEGSAKCLEFDVDLVACLVGMSPTFIRKALGRRARQISMSEVYHLLDLDAYRETFVRRSQVPDVLRRGLSKALNESGPAGRQQTDIDVGDALDLIPALEPRSVQCVVTSPPYWGMRLYDGHDVTVWADGDVCAFGNEQTPEAFLRHSTEILWRLKPAISASGSVWWNLGDSYNTRTQLRRNAAETLNAMRGNDTRGWHDHACRRYSAGHSYLKDGDRCLIPSRLAARASRIGYWVKSDIIWSKTGSMPETVQSRVSREVEHILHLTLQRSPLFNKAAYNEQDPALGGRSPALEAEKITDCWRLPTTSGLDGHGAAFPVSLPARCIALSTKEGDLVLDPFAGSGTTLVAATRLGRRAIGFDTQREYVAIAQSRVRNAEAPTL